jgi:putative flippase GtrA
MTKTYTEIKRFLIAGGVATCIHILSATSLISIFNLPPTRANFIAFCLAYIFSYTLHSKWSFSSHLTIQIFFKYTVVAVFNFILIYLLVSINELMGLASLYSVFFIAMINPIFNFLALKLWVYHKKPIKLKS